jgi:hypothetical protein
MLPGKIGGAISWAKGNLVEQQRNKGAKGGAWEF